MKISEEKLNSNYLIFLKKVEELNISNFNSSLFQEELGDKLRNATYGISGENVAYEGSFIDIVLRKITKYAVQINELLPEDKRVDKTTLVKVCLLHQISKVEMFQKTSSEYNQNKTSYFEFAPYNFALKCGLRSVALSMRYGIPFTEMELEAMTILDRPLDDEQVRFKSNMISSLIKISNEITNAELKIK